MEILIASCNENKIAEFRTIAANYNVNLISPRELKDRKNLEPIPEVEENELTFFGNSRLKAVAFAKWGGIAALADDSGLAVDILDGRPGIHSARYGGNGFSDRQRCEHLLKEINSINGFSSGRLSARFHCCLVLALQNGEQFAHETTLEGEIVESFLGENGFGYDPVVYIPSLGCSLAEMEYEQVCKLGFRAKAFAELSKLVPKHIPTR